MTITSGVYATREMLKRALEIGETARNNNNIDRALESGARVVDGNCHRIFYPRIATKYFDWPNSQGAVPWRLWLDDAELISATAVTSGGVVVPSTNYNLEPNRVGPPYNRLEINIGTSSALSSGSTYQQAIGITGLWGYTNDEYTVGTTVEALDTTETGIDVSANVSAEVGVGSVLRIDSERVIVSSRVSLDTGQNLAGSGLTTNKAEVTIPVADGTQFAVDEVITIDSERMLILDITGNNLTVLRAYDGSVLAAHTVGADIYAPRTLTVIRGAFGTTAAAHLTGATVYRWDPPAGIRVLNLGEAINVLMQEQTGWFRTMSASSNFGGTAKRAATIEALVNQREMQYQQYGRKARTRTI
jgi:hypothetical protein